MPDPDTYATYVEAAEALSSVEQRRRAALRRTIEKAAATEEQARLRLAEQQRMYDRAAHEAKDVERQLTELRTLLGSPPAPANGSVSEAQKPTALGEIRGQVRDVAQWATDASSTAESLLRSRARLATAPPAAVPAPLPAPVLAARTRSRLVIWLVAAAAGLVVIVIVALAVLAH